MSFIVLRVVAAIVEAGLVVILQVGADTLHVGDHVDACCRSKISRPTPESCSSCGELNAPLERITSHWRAP
jgi:hypothetical protein